MDERWKRILLDGEIPAWTKGGFTVFLSRNHGHEPPEPNAGQKDRHGHFWWFECVDDKGDSIGEAPTLARAKKLAH